MTIFDVALEAYGNAITYASVAGIVFAFLRIIVF